MRVQQYYFNVKKTGPALNIYICPDIHFDSCAFLKDEFLRWAEMVYNDPIGYVLILGDVEDADRPSTRILRRHMYTDRPEALTQENLKDMDWIDNKIVPMLKQAVRPNRCLGALDGDHYKIYENGLTSTQYICSKLNAPYLGDGQAVIKTHLEYTGGARTMVSIHAQHGIGAGKTGNNINVLENTANQWEGIDVFVRGHSHKTAAAPISKYRISHNSDAIVQRDIWLVNTSSFRTGFVLNKTDYAEARNYGATAHKYPVIEISTLKTRASKSTFQHNIGVRIF